MSRPGYWKTGAGIEIAYGDMQPSHVKNALRYLRKRYNELEGVADSVNYRNYCEQKLIELGNEAQRRQLVPPGDLPFARLLGCIAVWQADWDITHPTVTTLATYVQPFDLPAPEIPTLHGVPLTLQQARQQNEIYIKKNAGRLISHNYNILGEIAEVTQLNIHNSREIDILSERQLDDDL